MLEPESVERAGRPLVDLDIGPEQTVEQRELMSVIEEVLLEEMTPRQLSLVKAVALRGIPMEAIAQKLGVKRNALYKMMHDARLKLKRRMALEGLDLEETIAVFGQGNESEGEVV